MRAELSGVGRARVARGRRCDVLGVVAEVCVREQLWQMIHDGRIPVSERNLQVLRIASQDALLRTVERTSSGADLVMTDLDLRASPDAMAGALQRCQAVPDMLFVAARERILIE